MDTFNIQAFNTVLPNNLLVKGISTFRIPYVVTTHCYQTQCLRTRACYTLHHLRHSLYYGPVSLCPYYIPSETSNCPDCRSVNQAHDQIWILGYPPLNPLGTNNVSTISIGTSIYNNLFLLPDIFISRPLQMARIEFLSAFPVKNR